MAWGHLAIDRPRLVYMTLGAFTLLFMLVSFFIKERLYLGEAPVATLFGIIIGPRATNLLDPRSWPNHEQTILEFCRIVLVVQCFVVGLELPKYYVSRHWRSLFFLLGPVMICGWFISSFFIWVTVGSLSWVECLVCGACFNATDPLLASAAFGKSKFSKRIPLYLRGIILAESASNGAMAAPLLGLSLDLLRHIHSPKRVLVRWILITVLYQCIFGAVLGVLVGLTGRRAVKFADRRGMMDRNSFLAFYFVLALFSTGMGSLLGVDEVFTGFCAGVAFDNDDWFSEKTQESNISNVINLLLNLTFFICLGAIIPWEMYSDSDLGLTPWRLVILSLSIFLLRRIPIMLVFRPWIPDIVNWRESLFAGYFGPIGGGAVFAALLVQGVMEGSMKESIGADETSIAKLIWPITTFVVVCSTFLHGSSIAVWGFGRRVTTLTLTLTYTPVHEDGSSWLDRLPRNHTKDLLDDRSKKWLERSNWHSHPSRRRSLHPEDFFNNGQQTVTEGDVPSVRFSTLDDSAPEHRKAKSFAFGTASRKIKGKDKDVSPIDAVPVKKGGPKQAYQFGNTILVEDGDGEVMKTYTTSPSTESTFRHWTKIRPGLSNRPGVEGASSQNAPAESSTGERDGNKDVDHQPIARNRRIGTAHLIEHLRELDSEAHFEHVGEKVTMEGHHYRDSVTHERALQTADHQPGTSITEPETAVERRRRLAALGVFDDWNDSDSDDNGEPRLMRGSRANGSDARPGPSH
jgi:NhaP-type Na+/H+ or K+/H+ antiporter